MKTTLTSNQYHWTNVLIHQIKTLREAQGMSLEELSKRTNIPEFILIRFESGNVSQVTGSRIDAIAEALGKRVAVMLIDK